MLVFIARFTLWFTFICVSMFMCNCVILVPVLRIIHVSILTWNCGATYVNAWFLFSAPLQHKYSSSKNAFQLLVPKWLLCVEPSASEYNSVSTPRMRFILLQPSFKTKHLQLSNNCYPEWLVTSTTQHARFGRCLAEMMSQPRSDLHGATVGYAGCPIQTSCHKNTSLCLATVAVPTSGRFELRGKGCQAPTPNWRLLWRFAYSLSK